MFGLDSATYYAAVAYIAAVPGLLAEGRAQVASLQQQVAIEQASVVLLRADVLRARQQGDAANARFDKLSEQNQKLSALPLQKPLLADPRTYKVGGIFTLLGLIGGLVLHK